jgi:hypothetical protein
MRNRPTLRCALLVCVLLSLSFISTLDASRITAYSNSTAQRSPSVVQDTVAQITSLARYGGTYSTSVVDNGYIYFTQGSLLNILDASDPGNLVQVARMELPFFPFELQVVDDIVYMRGVSDDILIVDVNDHAAPVIRSRFPTTAYTSRMLAQGTTLYLADSEEFRIINTSEPASPVVVGTYDYAATWLPPFVVDDNKVYLQTSGGLHVIDISDPAEPRHVTIIPLDDDTSMTTARDNILYAVTEYACGKDGTCHTTKIYDVTDPTRPVLRKTYDGDPEVAFADSLALVNVSTGIKLLDVRDPTNIIERSSYDRSSYQGDTYISGIHVVGTTAYFQQGGRFQVLDISDPSQPRVRASFAMSQFSWLESDVGEDVAILYESSALEILDLRNSDVPQRVASLQSGGEVDSISVSDDRAYWINDYTGTHILDIGDVRDIREVGLYTLVGPQREFTNDIEIAGKNAFIGTDDGIHVVDVSVPSHPTLRSVFESPIQYTPLGVDWLKIVGDRLYVRVNVNTNVSKAYIFDISNPDQLKIIGTLPNDTFRQTLPLEVVGNLMYATSTDTLSPANRFFEVWDVSDPANPQRLSQMPLPVGVGLASDAAMSDGLIYIAAESDDYSSVHIVDVSNPDNPRLVASYVPQGRPVGIDVKNHLLYIHSADETLAGTPYSTVDIMDVHDPQKPVMLARHRTPEPWIHGQQDVQSRGGYIYVVEAEAGIDVLWYGPASTANLAATGGTLASHVDGTHYEVAVGTFAGSVELTHTPKSSLDAPDTAPLLDAQHIFEVSAVDATSNTPVQPTKPLSVTISYEDLMFTEETEAKLRLYWWDGTSWIEEPSSIADPEHNTVSARLSQTGTWALLAEGKTRTYIPLIFK